MIHVCSNQCLFCSHGCAQDWLARTGRTQGYVTRWYGGRLDSCYQEPPSAAGYFRSAGLHEALLAP